MLGAQETIHPRSNLQPPTRKIGGKRSHKKSCLSIKDFYYDQQPPRRSRHLGSSPPYHDFGTPPAFSSFLLSLSLLLPQSKSRGRASCANPAAIMAFRLPLARLSTCAARRAPVPERAPAVARFYSQTQMQVCRFPLSVC